jgi:hypothetical protein
MKVVAAMTILRLQSWGGKHHRVEAQWARRNREEVVVTVERREEVGWWDEERQWVDLERQQDERVRG